jgi:hypothetical protein
MKLHSALGQCCYAQAGVDAEIGGPRLNCRRCTYSYSRKHDCTTTSRVKRGSVYDLVTTSVYLPKDSMALTLNGTTKWASAKELQRLGETHMGATPARVRKILKRIEAAIADTSKELQAYIKAHAEFIEIGQSHAPAMGARCRAFP